MALSVLVILTASNIINIEASFIRVKEGGAGSYLLT
jgi:hypothetical protein